MSDEVRDQLEIKCKNLLTYLNVNQLSEIKEFLYPMAEKEVIKNETRKNTSNNRKPKKKLPKQQKRKIHYSIM